MIRIASATLTREMLSDFLMTQWAAQVLPISLREQWILKRNGIQTINLLVFGNAQKKFMTGIQKSMKSGDKTENMNTLQDYESYGIVYHPKDGYWYYNDQIIGIFIDTKKPIIYFNNSGSIYLSIAENSENGVMEIKEISEAEAQKLLRDNNSGNSASFTVETLK